MVWFIYIIKEGLIYGNKLRIIVFDLILFWLKFFLRSKIIFIFCVI